MLNVSDFLNTELRDFGSYDCLRSLGSYIDGQKNASRKVLYITQDHLTSFQKVSNFTGIVSSKSNYLHGESSLEGVIIGLAQEFAGTNNIPLLKPKGTFGSRFENQASASRYIFISKPDYFTKLFNPEDSEILIKQEFEGDEIEPRFFVPTLPLLLVNGCEGIATGFACKILPRDPKNIKKYIEEKLKGKKPNKKLLEPSYNGFTGTIVTDGPEVFIKGKISVKDCLVEIQEIPVQYDLKTYITRLDELEEQKVIRSYADNSDNDTFNFTIKTDREFTKKSEDEILNKLGLIKKVRENYTTIDENNSIKVFENVEEIIDAFLKIKLEYTQRRKDNILKKLNYKISILSSKALFIKGVVEGSILVSNKKKEEIIKQLESIKDIKKESDSYDYLLRMPIYSLTKEKYEELLRELKEVKVEYTEIKKTSIEDLYIKDLELLDLK